MKKITALFFKFPKIEFSSSRLSRKLIGSFLLVAAVSAAASITSYIGLQQIDSSYKNLLNREVAVQIKMNEIKVNAAQQGSNLLLYLDSRVSENKQNIQLASENLDNLLEDMIHMLDNPEDQQTLSQMKELNQKVKDFSDQVDKLIYSDYDGTMYKAKSEIYPISNYIMSITSKIASKYQGALAQEIQNNNSKVNVVTWTVILFSLLSVTFAIIIGWFVSRSISLPLSALSVSARKIAAGDLNVEQLTIHSKNEIGTLRDAFNRMVLHLRDMIRQVGESSEQVAASAQELTAVSEQATQASEMISSTIQKVSSGANLQFRSVDRAAGTIAEMAESVLRITESSENAVTRVTQASEQAQEGNQAIKKVIEQMSKTQDSVSNMSETIRNLGDQSKEIGQIVEVISGIASQTNLLALNAAIEAARAGEHGRGFSVVADEVRKLAEQSSKSAEQIAKLIRTIQTETEKAVQSMENGTQNVQEGIQIVNTAGLSFNEIQSSVKEVAEQIQKVSIVAKQMAENTDLVVSVFGQITEVSESTATGTQSVLTATEQQVASMEEITSSAASLNKLAEDLQELVRKFKI